MEALSPTRVDPLVVGFDGSDTAARAVEKAGELARALGATVHVVYGYGFSSAAAIASAGGVAVAASVESEAILAEAKTIVERARSSLEELGVEARTHISKEEAAQALIDVADSEGAQIIVVGNRGMSGARRVLGSVPNRVSHRARCGVLIVRTW